MNFILGNFNLSPYRTPFRHSFDYGFRPYNNFFMGNFNRYSSSVFSPSYFSNPIRHAQRPSFYGLSSRYYSSSSYIDSLYTDYSLSSSFSPSLNLYSSSSLFDEPLIDFYDFKRDFDMDLDFSYRSLYSSCPFSRYSKFKDYDIELKSDKNQKTSSISCFENKSIYNKEKSNHLAIIADFVAKSTRTSGYCARGVNDALEKAGIVKKDSTRRASAYQLKEAFDNTPSLKRVSVKREDLKKLPKGCIIVWQRGDGSANSPSSEHGHVCITLGNGKEASDDVRNLKVFDTEFDVYVPV